MAIATSNTANRAAWLAERRTGIGGSDAAAAVGLSKWQSPFQLWLNKRGESEVPENEAMRWGTLLEPVIREEYARRTNRTVLRPKKIIRSKSHPFALASLDGVTADDRLFEAKTSRTSDGWGDEGSDQVPIEYTVQVQHYMAVTGLQVADIAVLIGASDFRIYTIEADHEFHEMLMDKESAFWTCVESGEPPELTSPDDCLLRWKQSRLGVTVQAAREVSEAVELLKQYRSQIKELEAVASQYETTIKAAIGDAEALVGPDGKPLVTWKSTKPRMSFDSKGFAEAHPDLYAQYVREGSSSRQFLVK